MDKEIQKYLKELMIEYLSKNKVGSNLRKALSIFEKAQNNLVAVVDNDETAGIIGLKAVTVMTFAILKKMGAGKKAIDFSEQDWKEIVECISKYAILQDASQYVMSVFGMYEKYIRASADYVEGFVSEKKVSEIRVLADEIVEKTTLLKERKMSEVAYVEQCLWIALEAMIKLIASSVSMLMNEEYSELAYAMATYAFEYGRMSMYKQEQALLNELLESQYQLDQELQEKYDCFMQDMMMQSEQFLRLVDNAFVPEFREQFLGSIVLAKSIGVSEKEVLVTLNDIDSFFED